MLGLMVNLISYFSALFQKWQVFPPPVLETVIFSTSAIFYRRYFLYIFSCWKPWSIDIYTETRCPTTLCNAWKCITYRASYTLVKEWLICDKLTYIYLYFFLFFCFFKYGKIFENTLKLFKNMPEIFQRWFKNFHKICSKLCGGFINLFAKLPNNFILFV